MVSAPMPQAEQMPTEGVVWTVHPARESPLRAVFAVVAIGLAAALAARALPNAPAYLGPLVAVLLVFHLSSFFFASHYALDREAIRVRHLGMTRVRRFEEIRRIELGTRAALLSPFPKARALDTYRALVVPLHTAPPEARALLEAKRARSEGGAHP